MSRTPCGIRTVSHAAPSSKRSSSLVVPSGPASHVEASNTRDTLYDAPSGTTIGLSYSTSTSIVEEMAKGVAGGEVGGVPVAGAVAAVGQSFLGTDGRGAGNLIVRAGGARTPLREAGDEDGSGDEEPSKP